MKKIIAICICLTLLLSLAGCGHKHVMTQWSADPQNHWYVCECGDEAERGAHELNEDNMCAVCNAGIYDEGDGQFCVMTYDEWGSNITCMYYDADGNITSSQVNEREYYEDGNPKVVKTYMDGFLTYETIYLPSENEEYGGVYPSEDITYMEDGSKYVVRFANENDVESTILYAPDGSEQESTVYEYDYDEAGNLLGRRSYTNGALFEDTRAFVGPDGNVYDSAIIFYNADGSVSISNEYVYEFNDQGEQTYYASYYNGVISSESFADVDADGNLYTSRQVEYDEAGNVVSDTSYDAEGNVVE